MKSFTFIITCSCVVGLSVNSFATPVGALRPEAQANFQKLIKTNECPACDLAGVVLTRIDLSGANLEGANLAGAKLFLTDLSEANLKNANLQGAALGGADLAGADLRGANLTGAVLEGAYLKGAQIDGQIVSSSPYEAEDLPDVTEKKFVADQSQGKSTPYAQDAVVNESSDVTAEPAVQQGQEVVAPSAGTDTTGPAHSKTLVPMADAVVRPDAADSATEMTANAQAETSETASGDKESEGSGFWGSVTSFFSSKSSETDEAVAVSVEEEVAAPETAVVVEEVVVTPEEVTVVEEVPMATEPDSVQETGEIVAEPPGVPVEIEVLEPSEVAPEVVAEKEPDTGEKPLATAEVVEVNETLRTPSPDPAPLAEEQVQDVSDGEQETTGGFWSSVTSIFSSDNDEPEAKVNNSESTAEAAADAEVVAQTGKDELASDAGVRSMIEQIEGPAPTPVVEVQEEVAVVPGEEVIVVVEEEVAEPVETGTQNGEVVPPVAAEAEVAEQQPAVKEIAVDEEAAADDTQPTAGSEVSAMITQIEADSESQPAAPDALDYNVETPEQAKLKQQMILDRFLETERCVGCDLAGVDFSGKNLGSVDLERADLQGANLEGVDLGEANLKGVNFSGANLKDADLREADLYLADFTDADLTGARFEEALIDSAIFTDAKGANLEGAVKDE